MILYKYVSYDAGLKILESNSIGFSQPSNFNDPFELEAAYPAETVSDPIQAVLSRMRLWGKKHTWKQNTGILSLTRQPLNPLMWAHYCVSHTGMVLGIDCTIDEFTSEIKNLIPVQYGSVIYTDNKPNHHYLSTTIQPLEVGGTFSFSPQHLERLQRMFLFKPMCWSYEEEVRVVKCLKGIQNNKDIASGSFTELKVCGRPIYLLTLPKGAIKEVFLGVRSGLFDSEEKCNHFITTMKNHQPEIAVYGCSLSESSWGLERFDLTEE